MVASPRIFAGLLITTLLALPAATLAGPGETARAAVQRGADFLIKQQQPDGTWQPDPRVPPAITALALRALAGTSDFTPDSQPLRKGYQALLDQQMEDGGIYRDLLANYNTAIAVMALAEARRDAGDDRFTDAIDRGVAYLRRLQWTPETRPDFAGDDPAEVARVTGEEDAFYGGWGYGGRGRGPGRPDLSNAHLSIEALHLAGVPEDDEVFERALLFVTRLQNHSETNPAVWAGDDGGFVYGPAADRRGESMAGEFTTPDGQRRLRSYGSMTYAGLKSMVYAGLSHEDQRVQAAWDWISTNWTLEENPGMAAEEPERADQGLYYYYLTMARALRAYGEPKIQTPAGEVDWRIALINQLAALQREDGSWAGNPRWREEDPVMTTAFAVIALNNALADLNERPE